MNNRRMLAAGWAFALLVAISAIPSADGQDAKAEKKAKNGKAKGDGKEMAVKADSSMIPAPAKPNSPAAIAALLDSCIDAKLKEKKLVASPACTDEDYIRRVSLDVAGVVPTPERVRAFVADSRADKRAKLVEEVLADHRFGNHLADTWQVLLFPRDSDAKGTTREPLVDWLKQNFNADKSWNKIVYELLTSHGDLEQHGELTYYLANKTVDKLADSVSKVFMGLQLQCAQCHNHPFADWTQKEYWGLAQFFMHVQSPPNLNAAIKNGTPVTVTEVVTVRRNPNQNALPESALTVPPKFPGSTAANIPSSEAPRPFLARWLTAPDNPYFAKAFVNRLWSQYLGRGIVEPVDNLDEQSKAANPELLDILAKEFVAGGYDIKHIVQVICATRAYQRSSMPTAGNDKDHRYLSHAALKVMTPEQLYDSLEQVLEFRSERPRGKAAGGMMGKGQPKSPRDRFVVFFTGSDTAKPVDYEAGIPQALELMNNSKMSPKAVAERLARSNPPADAAIEQLFLLAYARKPTSEESAKLKSFAAKQATKAEAYGDILWVLLNSSEFTLIR